MNATILSGPQAEVEVEVTRAELDRDRDEERFREPNSTVHDGWRWITPGKCCECGERDDWYTDVRGSLVCGCQACPECGMVPVVRYHEVDCPTLTERVEDEG